MKVIGVAGQAGNGKNVIVDYLVKRLSERSNEIWKQASFAASVKKCFCDYFGKDLAFVEEWKRNPESPPGLQKPVRQALQFIGDGFRQIQSDIWIETAFRINEPPFILSDVRYFNEARAVRKHGGMNILIWRPGFENDDPNPSEAELRQVIEWFSKYSDGGVLCNQNMPNQETKLFDVFVRNEGDVNDLHAFVDSTVIPHIEKTLFGWDC
jgi:hypothetical protein